MVIRGTNLYQVMKISVLPVALLAAALFISGLRPAAAQPPPAGGEAAGPPAQGRGGPGGFAQAPATIDFADRTGFKQIFDGKTLNGWDGSTDIWRVEDGVIVAESTPEKPAGTTFLIYRGDEVADFELKLEIKIEGQGGNSGVQYRSKNIEPSANFGAGRGRGAAPGAPGAPGTQDAPGAPAGPGAPGGQAPRGGGPGMVTTYQKWNLFGYQADFDMNGNMAGQLFEGGRQPGERGITTRPGQFVVLREGQQPTLLANLASAETLRSAFMANDWNQYHIVARGYTFFHILNGNLVSVTIDEDPTKQVAKGLIGLQIEGSNLKVSFRDIWLKTL